MLAIWVILALFTLLAWAFFCRWFLDNPRNDFVAGIIWHGLRAYARLVHRVQIRGREHLPTSRFPGPLIVVSNHTAGVDPLLIQAVCNFEVRFIMAMDMRHPGLEWAWQIANIIFVDRHTGDALGAREAIRHVKSGGVLGIFPEGGLERPSHTILPFGGGVGLIIKRAHAPVLCITIDGTPITERAWGSLVKRSRAVLTFHPLIRYARSESAEAITADLRRRYVEWTNWPVNDHPPPPPPSPWTRPTPET